MELYMSRPHMGNLYNMYIKYLLYGPLTSTTACHSPSRDPQQQLPNIDEPTEWA